MGPSNLEDSIGRLVGIGGKGLWGKAKVIMASSTNSWLQTNLLSQHDLQQQNSSHALYHSSEISLHGASSAHLNQSQHLELGHGSHGMEPYCQPLHHTLNAGLHLSGNSQQPVQPSNAFPGSRSVQYPFLFPENSSTLHSSYICISQLITFLATVHMINQSILIKILISTICRWYQAVSIR